MAISKTDKRTITQSDDLVFASLSLNAKEYTIFMLLLSRLNPNDFEGTRHSYFNISELFSFDPELRKSYYTRAQNTARSLKNKTSSIYIKDSATKRWMDIAFISKVEGRYTDDEIRVSFTEEIKPFVSELKGNFTKFALYFISQLDGVYAKRLYSMAFSKEWLNQKKEDSAVLEISLEEFKVVVGIYTREKDGSLTVNKNSYEKWSNFSAKILAPAIEEINTKTDLLLKFEPMKTGRKITGLKFYIKKKDVSEFPDDLSIEDARRIVQNLGK